MSEEKIASKDKDNKESENAKKVRDFLDANDLDVVSQISIVLDSGDIVPIRGIISNSFVTEKKKDGGEQQKNTDTGKE